MNSMVAIIKSVIGQVFAVSADGVKRQVFEGDRLFQGEQLLTGEFGAVTLQMPDGQNIELGNNQQWPLPTDNSKQQDTDTSRDELLQAIAAGIEQERLHVLRQRRFLGFVGQQPEALEQRDRVQEPLQRTLAL